MTLLKDDIKCTKCSLFRTCHKQVFGEGNKHASVVFVGKAPGATEDIKGRPFIGKSGKTLRRFIKMFDLESESYITNICCCRPPGNRDPSREEIKACLPRLKRLLKKIKPKVIVPLGNVALQALTKKTGITKKRGKPFYMDGFYYLPMVHPAYIDRAGDRRREVLKEFADDFSEVINILDSEEEDLDYRFVTRISEAKRVLRRFTKASIFTFDNTNVTCEASPG